MKFRKKPIVIEAHQLGDNHAVIPEWIEERLHKDILIFNGSPADPRQYGRIDTGEGELKISPGDWIIKGIKGEIYPCKPDIFAATYEAVNE